MSCKDTIIIVIFVNMKKAFVITLFSIIGMMSVHADKYSQLWQTVNAMREKDLPESALLQIRQIEQLAEQEKKYGQLIAAQLTEMQIACDRTPDSIAPIFRRLCLQRQKAASDTILCLIYDITMERIPQPVRKYRDSLPYSPLHLRDVDEQTIRKLSQTKVDNYLPLIRKGTLGKYFKHDLLSVIGFETQEFAILNRFYTSVGNREAALLTAIEKSAQMKDETKFLNALDSLEALYSDIDLCAAITSQRLMYITGYEDSVSKKRYELIQTAIQRWPHYENINALKNQLNSITRPHLSGIEQDGLILPNQEIKIRFNNVRNIESANIKVNGKHYKKSFATHQPWESAKDSILIGGMAPGQYKATITTIPKTSTQTITITVSGIMTVAEALPNQQIRIVALDAKTGFPIPEATVQLTYGYDSKAPTINVTCDANGETTVNRRNGNKELSDIRAQKNGDIESQSIRVPIYQYFGNKPRNEVTHIYTDRAIYRPGQSVHVATLTFSRNEDKTTAVKGRKQTIILRDQNRKIVAETTVTTDEFGKSATDFALPTDILNGTFSISTDNATQSISVEEYKRPTFEIIFPQVTRQYGEGDTLMLYTKVKTFSGIPVRGAKVRYNVKRTRPQWYWRDKWPSIEILEDSATTDTNGGFYIPVHLTLPNDDEANYGFYNFTIQATATNLNGETHDGSMTLPLGRKAAIIECWNGNKQILLPKPIPLLREEMDSLRLRAVNASGKETATDITTIWSEENGISTLTATCEYDTLRQQFIIFERTDTKPRTHTKDWFWVSSDTFTADGIDMQIGSSDSIHILYTIFAEDKIVENGSMDVSNSLINRRFFYDEAWGDGIFMNFLWVKDGKTYIHTATLRKPLPEKTIPLRWTTFRDRLTPGQHEEWRLRVDATSATSLMMTMYDKSLDVLRPHEWQLNLGMQRSLPWAQWENPHFYPIDFYLEQEMNFLKEKGETWNMLNPDYIPTIHTEKGYIVRSSRKIMMAKATMDSSQGAVFGVSANAISTEEASFDNRNNGNKDETPQSTPIIRENLNETAFFYPRLLADKDGNIDIQFTLPEALTTWKVLGLANTQDMDYSIIEAEAVAQKALMAEPNIPRFIRKGDKATIATTITNLSATDINGQARLELIDATTENTILSLKQLITIGKGETSVTTFSFDTQEMPATLYICRIYAEGGKFSDGEQHYLPLLSDEMIVTNTRAITQHGQGEKSIALKALIPDGAKGARVMVEYTNNPLWTVIQALPWLRTANEEDAISSLQAYYSTRLASEILASSPQLETTLKTWAAQNDETRLSPLLTDNELKQALISQTPWMREAEKESQWKVQLSSYFDRNTLRLALKEDLQRLAQIQHTDGSFGWIKGLEGSFHITLSVASNLARLNSMFHLNDNQMMINAAMQWLTTEVHKSVEDMRRNKAPYITTGMVQYLYTCAIAGIPQSQEAKRDNAYLIDILKKDVRNRSIYEKALTAIILAHQGEESIAREYAQSLLEYSVCTEEMGRYYDTPRATYSWRDYRIPTQVAAIEAIAAITPEDTESIDEMQRWLLQEKRTQFWQTPMNCMDAIHAFMCAGTLPIEKAEPTAISIDNRPLDIATSSIGLGYGKTWLTYGNEQTITFTRHDERTGWGAVYAQFIQKNTDIQASQMGMSITRTINMPKDTLHVGDRMMVTLTITADRDYDFVHIIDRRAANMESVKAMSHYEKNYYVSQKDYQTDFFFQKLPKGTHRINTEYFIDRTGTYLYSPATMQCAYAPEFSARSKADTITVK